MNTIRMWGRVWIGLCVLIPLWGLSQGCGGESKKCQTPQDCATGQVCTDGQCVAATPGPCQKDGDCKANEQCNQGKCEAKPTTCTETSCQAGEFCFLSQRCVKTPVPCKTNGDCAEGELCIGPETSTVCMRQCDTTENKDGGKHASCWGGWGICETLSAAAPERGICLPPREKTQKKGEACKQNSDMSKPSYHDCGQDLNCVEGLCLENCDPNKGLSTNPVCPAGMFCKGKDNQGLCEKLPDPKEGTKVAGEFCSNRTANLFCDGKAGLACINGRCEKACDLRKGKDSNPACTSDDLCAEDVENSHIGGYCLRKPTQKKDDPCNTTTQKCLEGLTCSGGRCATSCDPQKTTACGLGEVCSKLGNVCVVSCDPSKGTNTNPTCAVGWTCITSTSTPPGYCRGLPNFDQGPVQVGEACDSFDDTKSCDGKKELFCYQSLCFKACDPRKGASPHPSCQTSEECVESNSSPLGGLCLPKATQKEYETCSSLKDRCLAGLNCSNNRCGRVCDLSKPQPSDCKTEEYCVTVCSTICDPDKGEVGNAACPARYACIKSASLYKPGYCRPLPPEPKGTRKYGESCSFGAEESCDGSAGLLCVRSVCVKACDPSKGKDSNPNCDSGQTCELQLNTSFLGGVCTTTPTQKENEICNTTDKLCLDELTCVSLEGSTSYCLKSCSPAQPEVCKDGATCEQARPGQYACLKMRNNTRKLYESCKGAPNTPEYDNCGGELLCVRLQADAKSFHCLPPCAPPKTCAEKTVCTADPNGLRVCSPSCQTDADCKDYGTTCKQNGANSFCI